MTPEAETPAFKRASEVFYELGNLLDLRLGDLRIVGMRDACLQLIARALEEFAEEQVKKRELVTKALAYELGMEEASNESYERGFLYGRDIGASKMRERAAKVAESKEDEALYDAELLRSSDEYDLPRERDWIARSIRAIPLYGEEASGKKGGCE